MPVAVVGCESHLAAAVRTGLEPEFTVKYIEVESNPRLIGSQEGSDAATMQCKNMAELHPNEFVYVGIASTMLETNGVWYKFTCVAYMTKNVVECVWSSGDLCRVIAKIKNTISK
jgi:hypothetical protein